MKVNVSLIGAACGATVMIRRIVLAVALRVCGIVLARLNSMALLNDRAYQRGTQSGGVGDHRETV